MSRCTTSRRDSLLSRIAHRLWLERIQDQNLVRVDGQVSRDPRRHDEACPRRRGRLVSAGYDETVIVWGLRTRRMVRQFRDNHSYIFDVKSNVLRIVGWVAAACRRRCVLTRTPFFPHQYATRPENRRAKFLSGSRRHVVYLDTRRCCCFGYRILAHVCCFSVCSVGPDTRRSPRTPAPGCASVQYTASFHDLSHLVSDIHLLCSRSAVPHVTVPYILCALVRAYSLHTAQALPGSASLLSHFVLPCPLSRCFPYHTSRY